MTDEEFDRELLHLRLSAEERWHKWQGAPPPEVFHYTKALAASKIIDSGKLWAVISSQLIDRTELVHAADTLRQLLFDRLGSPEGGDSLRHLYPPSVWRIGLEEGSGIDIFVSSLTQLENDLTQWDRYADRFYGVALGFDSGVLAQMDTSDEAAFPVGYVRVAYDRSDQESFFEKLIDLWLEQVPSNIAEVLDKVADRNMYIASRLGNLAVCAAAFFPRMKRQEFQAESEWRLIHGHLVKAPDCAVIHADKKTHVELDLGCVDGRMPLTSVWLGPGIANRESERRVRQLLDGRGYGAVPIRVSKILLRIENRIVEF
ncbi:MAG TPA: DUF2971 domain-containing protein [Thermoanaerobaculia bacterium]|jgi:hypothetical protein|nr:DUF2971 domain-containing protein [Thermoanaerobaculia bacterium]